LPHQPFKLRLLLEKSPVHPHLIPDLGNAFFKAGRYRWARFEQGRQFERLRHEGSRRRIEPWGHGGDRDAYGKAVLGKPPPL